MENELNAEQQRRLLSIAREAVEQYVKTGRTLEVEETDPVLMRPGAAFVTLTKGGALRGCIGSLTADAPLAETVRTRAIDAATHDPRFGPVQAKEIAELEIEISVLSPVRRVDSAEEIDISRHGVIVSSGSRQGVFLPQVAAETGWSREVLLSRLCQDKAGLEADAWKKGAALYVFTVQAFSAAAAGEDARAGE
jgi:AmmeMemoRadiSam system protein A